MNPIKWFVEWILAFSAIIFLATGRSIIYVILLTVPGPILDFIFEQVSLLFLYFYYISTRILRFIVFVINLLQIPYLFDLFAPDFFQNTVPGLRWFCIKAYELHMVPDLFSLKNRWNLDLSAKHLTQSYPQRAKQKVSKLEIKELEYPLQHAICAYPASFLYCLGILPSYWCIALSTKDIIENIFELTGDDWMIECDEFMSQCFTFLNPFLYFRGRNDVYKPSFYFLRDDNKHKYVLAVRGSTSATDWITDASAYSVPFMKDKNGRAHHGMFKSAKYIYDTVIDTIRDIYDNNKSDYELIITGHSLGGGVSSMLGLLFIEDDEEKKRNKNILNHLKVYSFATPSIVTLDIAAIGSDFITSIILNTDIVGRVGIKSWSIYNDRLYYVQNHEDDDDDTLLNGVCSAPPNIDEKDDNEWKDGYLLYPVGRVFWAKPKERTDEFAGCRARYILASICSLDNGTNVYGKDMYEYGKDKWDIYDVSQQREMFSELIFNGWEAIYAHFPYRYAWAVGLKRTFKYAANVVFEQKIRKRKRKKKSGSRVSKEQ